MPKKHKLDRRLANADFRHRVSIPVPANEVIEAELINLLGPGSFAAPRIDREHLKYRERILTLPVMTGLVVSLVWRQANSLSEILRLLSVDPLLWVKPLTVSVQALSKRLQKLPAPLFASVLDDVLKRLRERNKAKGNRGEAAPAVNKQRVADQIAEKFPVVWIADTSTMEAMRRTTSELQEKKRWLSERLGGVMFMIVDAVRHIPVHVQYTPNAHADEHEFAGPLLERLPAGGLVIFDQGFFWFALFDRITEEAKFYVTRLHKNTRYKVLAVLSEGPRYRDEIIQMGMNKGHPCNHPARLVSVLWNKTWYTYLTNVLDPETLSAQQVCALYRQRWRIEEAFLLTKRLLGLSYLWVGGTNGVEIQVYATWIFYTVLIDLCQELAEVLSEPIDRISVEMVFRSLYRYGRVIQREPRTDLIEFLRSNAKLFGLVKARRKRHRLIDEQSALVWSSA